MSTLPPSAPPPARSPRPRSRSWGIASFTVAMVGIVPILLVFLLAATVDELYGWLLIPAFGWALLTGLAGAVLGVVGLIAAGSESGGRGWPVAGVVLSVALVAPIAAVVYG